MMNQYKPLKEECIHNTNLTPPAVFFSYCSTGDDSCYKAGEDLIYCKMCVIVLHDSKGFTLCSDTGYLGGTVRIGPGSW